MGRSLIVIPAHLSSERLPGKVLLQHKGHSLLEWTYRQALRCFRFADVVVATSDDEVAEAVRDFNGICVHTPGVEFPNGTSRAFAAYETMRDHWDCRHHQTVIVWQADEPFIEPATVYDLTRDRPYGINTVVGLMDPILDFQNPNVVKAVLTENTPAQRIAWFTRQPIPYAFIHLGIYSFTTSAIAKLKELDVHHYAKQESLEQLTWLANGWGVGAIKLETCAPLSINTPDDWERFTQQ